MKTLTRSTLLATLSFALLSCDREPDPTPQSELFAPCVETCQKLGVIREGDPLKQAIFIVSTVHGFVSLANDNRLAHFSEEGVDLDTIKDFVITTIFEGLGAI